MGPRAPQGEARPRSGGDGREPFHLPGLASCPLALLGGGREQSGNERRLFGQPDPATAPGVTGCLWGSISSPTNMRMIMTPSAMLSQGLNTGKTPACGNRSTFGSCYRRGLLAGWLPVLCPEPSCPMGVGRHRGPAFSMASWVPASWTNWG